MSARPRDLLKTREARLGEVLTETALKSGHANSQAIVSGNVVTVHADPDEFAVSAGSVVLAQALVDFAAVADVEVAAGAATAAGQYRKVLIERNAAGAVSQVVGEASTVDQAFAALPAPSPDKIAIAWLELPPSFTPGVTALTGAMIKAMKYHA